MHRNKTSRPRRTRAAAAVLLALLAVVTRLAVTALPAGAVGGTYTVTSTADNGDTNTADGLCKAATNPVSCTFRAALMQANADAGPTTINFNLTGTGPFTIASFTSTRGALPALTEGNTTINGYSQPGSAVNTDQFASNAVIQIQLAGVEGNPDALLILSSNNVVRGLAIYGANREVRMGNTTSGGTVQSANDNVIAGNFLGTNAAGTFGATSRENSQHFGVIVRSASKRNTLGGPAVADRNVLSGHRGRPVLIGVPGSTAIDTGVTDNVVQNNIFGLTPNGQAALHNYGHAIDINNGASNNTVRDNVISGAFGVAEGVEVSHSVNTVGNQVLNNKIGTDPSGTSAPAYASNGGAGIRVEDGAHQTVVRGNTVGNSSSEGGIEIDSLQLPATSTLVEDNFIGVTPDGVAIPNAEFGIHITQGEGSTNTTTALDTTITGNTIAHNPIGIGIDGAGAARNKVTENSIHDNAGLGIDLTPTGQVNQNDAGDTDSGPNTLLNWPELTSATNVSVSGTACGGCTVEVFDTDAGATVPANLQTSYGEGQTFLSSTTAAPDGSFTATLPLNTNGRIVTATATDTSGNTSEFSRNFVVPGNNGAPVAAFKANCPDLGCTFDAAPTTDPDNDAITSYTWAFGDGGSATGTATPSHTYGAAGTYRVTLTVQDAQGGTGTNTSSVFVSGDTRKARDGFSRAVAGGWGTAEIGGAWTGTGGNSGLSVTGGVGRANIAVNSSKEAVLSGVSTQQTDASITVTASRSAVGGDHLAAIVARRQDATVAYRGRLRITSTGAVFAGVEAGGTLLGETQVAGLTAPAGTALRLRVRVTGANPTTIEVKVWRADQAEPGAFSFTTTDSTAGLQQAGTVGVRVSSTETVGGNVNFSVDDVDVVAPK